MVSLHCQRLAMQRMLLQSSRVMPAPAAITLRRPLCNRAAVDRGRPTVLVPVADGSEEIEAVSIVDTLVRAGAAVTMASVEPRTLQVTCSRGVAIVADALITDCVDRVFDAIVLPGGMPGAERLRDDSTLTGLLRAQHSSGRLIGAVCASPAVVLAAHDLLGDRATCFPAPQLQQAWPLSTTWVDERVVLSRNCRLITSQGPGTSLEFAIAIVEQLLGKDVADAIAQQMLVTR